VGDGRLIALQPSDYLRTRMSPRWPASSVLLAPARVPEQRSPYLVRPYVRLSAFANYWRYFPGPAARWCGRRERARAAHSARDL